MNIVPILCLLIVIANAETLKEVSKTKNDGGLEVEENILKSINPGHNGKPISGRFLYTGEAGQQYDVFYFADIYGYQAQGRLVDSTHPLADFIRNADSHTRITLKTKYGLISDIEC